MNILCISKVKIYVLCVSLNYKPLVLLILEMISMKVALNNLQ